MYKNYKNEILIIISITILGFLLGYTYYKLDYNLPLLDTFLIPALVINMFIAGGPHGNISEITTGIGTGVQFLVLYFIIKYIIKISKKWRGI